MSVPASQAPIAAQTLQRLGYAFKESSINSNTVSVVLTSKEAAHLHSLSSSIHLKHISFPRDYQSNVHTAHMRGLHHAAVLLSRKILMSKEA